jgi:hypothetical protein
MFVQEKHGRSHNYTGFDTGFEHNTKGQLTLELEITTSRYKDTKGQLTLELEITTSRYKDTPTRSRAKLRTTRSCRAASP